MRPILTLLCLLMLGLSAKSQSWQPGTFYDVKGTKNTGLIALDPRGKGPIKDENFIGYKEDKKADAIKLSASDLRSFVIGRDSFIVVAPIPGSWSKYELDFVRVVVDAPLRLFAAQGGSGSGRSGFSPGFSIGGGTAIGGGYGGGMGGGLGGGISIPIGGSGGGRGNSKTIYFYGANTAEMKPITTENFIDVMTEIMGDEPDVVEKIQTKKFGPRDMDKLLAYFYQIHRKD